MPINPFMPGAGDRPGMRGSRATLRTLRPTRRAMLFGLLILGALLTQSPARAHPLEFHLEPLTAATVERVLTSFELLTTELAGAGALTNARLPENALGITALLWSLEDAVAALDETWPENSEVLLRSLAAAGYERSPWTVAEWKVEAERVLESYEVLRGELQLASIHRELAELEQQADRLTADEVAERESALIRQLSMLQTTAGDIAAVAPYRSRLDKWVGRLLP